MSGLRRDGETAAEAVRRIERRRDYAALVKTAECQALLEDAWREGRAARDAWRRQANAEATR